MHCVQSSRGSLRNRLHLAALVLAFLVAVRVEGASQLQLFSDNGEVQFKGTSGPILKIKKNGTHIDVNAPLYVQGVDVAAKAANLQNLLEHVALELLTGALMQAHPLKVSQS